jgi:hypothetical protein
VLIITRPWLACPALWYDPSNIQGIFPAFRMLLVEFTATYLHMDP